MNQQELNFDDFFLDDFINFTERSRKDKKKSKKSSEREVDEKEKQELQVHRKIELDEKGKELKQPIGELFHTFKDIQSSDFKDAKKLIDESLQETGKKLEQIKEYDQEAYNNLVNLVSKFKRSATTYEKSLSSVFEACKTQFDKIEGEYGREVIVSNQPIGISEKKPKKEKKEKEHYKKDKKDKKQHHKNNHKEKSDDEREYITIKGYDNRQNNNNRKNRKSHNNNNNRNNNRNNRNNKFNRNVKPNANAFKGLGDFQDVELDL